MNYKTNYFLLFSLFLFLSTHIQAQPLAEAKPETAGLSAKQLENIDALFEDVPKAARLDKLVDLPLHQSEAAVERHMTRLSNKSVSASSVPFFCGAGANCVRERSPKTFSQGKRWSCFWRKSCKYLAHWMPNRWFAWNWQSFWYETECH